VRRRSWSRRPGIPGALQAVRQDFDMERSGWPFRWNTEGTTRDCARFDPAGFLQPTREHLAQGGSDREGAAVAVFRLAGLEAHEPTRPVHLRPAEREGFRLRAPAGDEAEPRHVRGQLASPDKAIDRPSRAKATRPRLSADASHGCLPGRSDASAKSLKGDERKGFMSKCLKADKKM